MIYAISSGILGATSAFLSKLAIKNSLFIFALVILSNLAMFKTFSVALDKSSSTLKVTIINTAANIIMTGLYGLYFGETVGFRWLAGLTLISIGTIVMSKESNKKQD